MLSRAKSIIVATGLLSSVFVIGCKHESNTTYGTDSTVASSANGSTGAATSPTTPPLPANIGRIGSHSVRTAWPFTVDSGYLSCDNHKLYFTAIGGDHNGQKYAMNGEAMNDHQFPKIDEIWKKGEKTPNVNITEVFDRGMTLCK